MAMARRACVFRQGESDAAGLAFSQFVAAGAGEILDQLGHDQRFGPGVVDGRGAFQAVVDQAGFSLGVGERADGGQPGGADAFCCR